MPPALSQVEPSSHHVFQRPTKQIRDAKDVDAFLCSKAYASIMTFLQQLNRAMVPCKCQTADGPKTLGPASAPAPASAPLSLPIKSTGKSKSWPLDSKDISIPEPVRRVQQLLSRLEAIVQEVPPSTGPRRFGNIAFRDWHARAEAMVPALFAELIRPGLAPAFVARTEKAGESASPGEQGAVDDADAVPTAETELHAYLMGSFGSSQRLDYGTGHELSFLAFVAALWMLGYFDGAQDSQAAKVEEEEFGVRERAIVVGIIEPYLQMMRRLIKKYTLEPAGSHGVWGLDDHFFLPYILGSAQLCPPVTATDPTPIEGSVARAPKPAAVTSRELVDMYKHSNMYFSAVGFIYDVKRGPFWEHSPVLYDVSGIRDGWGKINKGMLKMYNAEVLSKFPVVQHFVFGSLFSWDRYSQP
ncbi:Serine/threonine-protein phosphatase 2A activator 1 [Ascosphaera acerosa]|nr:Serine/threonine-protein phosphatase 2A activator 1 [Ascosphaera acerosa]